jgi:hypothetical protein
MTIHGDRELTDELREFAGFVFPFVGVRQRGLALGNALPARQFGQFSIEFNHMLLVFGSIFFRINGIGRAFWNADRAIDTFIGVNNQKIRAFAEAVNGANIHTVGIFALDTGFGDDMGHDELNKVKRNVRDALEVLL